MTENPYDHKNPVIRCFKVNMAEARIRVKGKIKRLKARISSLTPKSACMGFLGLMRGNWLAILIVLFASASVFNAFKLSQLILGLFYEGQIPFWAWLLMISSVIVVGLLLASLCLLIRKPIQLLSYGAGKSITFIAKKMSKDKLTRYVEWLKYVPTVSVMLGITVIPVYYLTQFTFNNWSDYFSSDNWWGMGLWFVNVMVMTNLPNGKRYKDYELADDETVKDG